MQLNTPYAFGKTIDLPFEEAQKRVREELGKLGFGILTEIDVRQKFAEKLQKDFRNYVILGACNPGFAYQALEREINIGALLPCNVLVYTTDDGRTAVVVKDPIAALAQTGNAEIAGLAAEVADQMKQMLAALEP
ncbi:DUF302 domain-containing protein [Geomesophilobacter sediminis]|uniref:DUF302 domain-containing protein n=1 Tax=Geomesophilobacter sediminis TaxID=2798584 RepID=A0A8J7M4C8_9BACT|nr:DUF302 domain-containing protein [Geomesophilobacter sediminis]MBJ6727788.1 DUF302 domain-containing protein [Geomesophilobacter sediminis]